MVQCSRCKTWRLINPFRCTGENNAAGAKDAAIWSREGIKTGEVKAQSRKQFQSAGGSLRDQVNVGRERSKTKKELYKKKKEKNRPTDRQIDGKRMGEKKGREETEDRENRREDRKIKKKRQLAAKNPKRIRRERASLPAAISRDRIGPKQIKN